MATAGSLINTLSAMGFWTALTIGVGVIILILGALLTWWIIYKKKWNLKITFKLIRGNGAYIGQETGKGRFDFRTGTLYLKRPWKTAEGKKIPKLDKYLQGDNSIEVVGNPGNWTLVIPQSYTEVTDEETGEKAMFVDLVGDTKDDKAWAVQFERSSKQTFSVMSLLQEYKEFLGWGFLFLIIIVSNFVGFSLILGKIH